MAEGPSGVQSAAIPGQQTNSQKQTKLDSLTSENKSDDTKTQARAGCNRYENIDEVKRVKKMVPVHTKTFRRDQSRRKISAPSNAPF